MRRIAVVIPRYGLVGGAEGFAYEVTERLACRTDLEIHVFANQWRKGNAQVLFHKVPVVSFPRFMKQISFAALCKRKIRPEFYDLIHSHERIFRMDLFTMHGIPHRTWVREARQKRPSLFDRSVIWVEERGLQSTDLSLFMPVSTLVKEEYLRLYPLPETRMRVIHPGISPERFASLDRDECRKEIRDLYGLSPEDVVLLFVGMNFEIKSLGLVMEGLSQWHRQRAHGPCMKLLVVGKGSQDNYARLARELGIAGHVAFAGVTREPEKYYLASDLFAMPSVFDTFGMAVLEAMAAGLPVIITPTVGAKDLVTDGVHGFILKNPPSREDLSQVLSLLMDREVRLQMGERAKACARMHSWENVAEEIGKIYQGNSQGRRPAG